MKNRLIIIGADFSANALIGQIETSYSLRVDVESVEVSKTTPATIYATSELQTYNDDVLMGSVPAPISVSATNGVVATVGNPDGSLYPIVIDGSAATAERCTVTIAQIGSSNIATVEAICQIYAIKRTTNAPLMDVVYAQGWSASPDYMTFDEAAAVTTFGTALQNNTEITSFDEGRYFSGASNWSLFMSGSSSVKSFSVGAGAQNMSNFAYNMAALESIDISQIQRDVVTYFSLYGCPNLQHITPNVAFAKISTIVFRGCAIPPEISTWDFSGVSKLSVVDCFREVKGENIVLDLRSWKAKVSSATRFVYQSDNVITLDVSTWDFSKCTSAPAFWASKLANCSGFPNIKISFTINMTSLTAESVENIIRNLGDLTGQTAATCTLGATNLAKVSDDIKAIATAKNWTLA